MRKSELNLYGELYNCADDLPSTQSEVVVYAAKLLNVSAPEPVEVSSLPDCAQSFYLGSKNLSNIKAKRDLGISLVYPNYKLGLESFYAEELKSHICAEIGTQFLIVSFKMLYSALVYD